MNSVVAMELSSSVETCGVTMVTSSLTSTNMSMLCKFASSTSEVFPNFLVYSIMLLHGSEVPKDKNEDSINLDAPRKREKPTGDQEMVTVKKVFVSIPTIIRVFEVVHAVVSL